MQSSNSSPTVSSTTAVTIIGFTIAGIAGVSAGGPLWGFLGVASLLLCVWWISHLFQYNQVTQELARYYETPEAAPVPVRAAARIRVPRRERTFVLIPLGELETAPR